jgi:hypothetical protein
MKLTVSKMKDAVLACSLVGACGGDDASVGATSDGSTSTATTGSSDESRTTSATTSSSTADTTGADDDDTTTGQPASCDDDVRNGDETDVDCGGSTCAPCNEGQTCNGDTDCAATLSCSDGTCQAPSCSDGIHNGDETDVDCGGSCEPCGPGADCSSPADCASGICLDGSCTAANCRDGVQNGSETDVDCGGPSCLGCPADGSCESGDDCATLACEEGVCVEIECTTNGHCTHLAGTCVVGQCNQATNTCQAVPAFQGAGCNDGNACTSATCNAGVCSGPQIDCSAYNGQCTSGACDPDIGCYGAPINEAQACSDGNACTNATVCVSGECTGTPVDCSHLDFGCEVGQCNQANGQCLVQLLPDGVACDDGFACSTNATCDAGVCVPGNLAPFWTEDFADNNAGWSLGTEWEIGPAVASSCTNLGQDPATDHTQAGDDGLAGVVIGGCASQTVHDYYCLTSPTIDTTVAQGPLFLEFWRHLHSDWPNWMRNKIDVFDGEDWVNIWISTGMGAINDPDWLQISHELTSYKSSAFQVRFCFNVEAIDWQVASWSVDDVALLSCP